MSGEVDMEVVTIVASDGVVRQKHIMRGDRLAMVQERRDDGDQVTAYIDTGTRDDVGRRVLSESAPALR